MKNPLLVIRISGTMKQILRILEVLLEAENIMLNKTLGELMKEGKKEE